MTKASDHPTTDTLAKTDANGVRVGDDVDTGGTEVKFSFGSRNIRVDKVPEMGDTFLIMLKVKVNGDGNKENAKGELYPRRDLTILGGWQPGKKPLSEDSQPGLYEIDPVNGAPANTGDDDTGDDDDSVDTGQDDTVVAANFSDAP
ncbi:hypothetical protein [Mycolicibacterium komossense]|uniref:Uncharacterized protein n=1 Tax=Mycolicibacterium komossense TaxID=1779 RepID=A0ABT3CMP2_9MYCO|nr:hypothetical protein [Mycolicibacterium komossense]MCV7230710.1 hypothetical protein [Mycolicibacterium komossense]